jgi:EAL domain-containing protein (putative c-di-GMP-specific phosphodiesterase class I)
MLKIDRRFVNGLGVDPMATSLTTAILGLVSSVRLGCVAEGVETREQFDFLVKLGCPQMQGWLWAPALRTEQALELVCSGVNPATAP